MSNKDLRDHAEGLLDAIVSDMKSSQRRHQQSEKSKGRGGGGVLSGSGKNMRSIGWKAGYRLDQLAEYRDG